jgi:hypothetical protein
LPLFFDLHKAGGCYKKNLLFAIELNSEQIKSTILQRRITSENFINSRRLSFELLRSPQLAAGELKSMLDINPLVSILRSLYQVWRNLRVTQE